MRPSSTAEPRTLGHPQPAPPWLRGQGWLPASQRVSQGPCALDHTEAQVGCSIACPTGHAAPCKSREEHSQQGLTDDSQPGLRYTDTPTAGTGRLHTCTPRAFLLTAPAAVQPTGPAGCEGSHHTSLHVPTCGPDWAPGTACRSRLPPVRRPALGRTGRCISAQHGTLITRYRRVN